MTDRPRYVIGVPGGVAPPAAIDRTLRSVLEQPGEVSIVIAGRASGPVDPRVQVTSETADLWRVCAERADRDGMVAVIEPGDTLRQGALGQVSQTLGRADDLDIVYTDERVNVGPDAGDRLKPNWSPERARCHDYCGQLTVFRACTLEGLGTVGSSGLTRPHAVLMHASARARRIEHLPVIAFERAHPIAPPVTRSRPPVDVRPSVVVPTVGTARSVWGSHRVLVVEAIDTLLELTDPRPQVVVVVDPATPPDVRRALARRDVVMVNGDTPFNYARACNLGVAATDGDVVVLLNDDTRVEDGRWLHAMSSFFAEPDVGVVGAKLLHADGTLQHAGILLNGQPLHIFRGYAGDDPGPFDLLRVSREVSAVTGACLATPRALWEELDGLDPSFALAGNDVDYCLRARRAGRRVIWTPDATLYHFEAQSRGDDTPPADVALLYERWGEQMHIDPYGNANFEPRQAEWIGRQPLGMDQRIWRGLCRLASHVPRPSH